MKKSVLLQTFAGENKKIPVWFMRQAGRYLPSYQEIRRQYSLEEMFRTPELAAEITCLPVKQLGVDAAILFADILTLPSAMGFKIRFDNSKGPVIQSPITSIESLTKIHDIEQCDHVQTTIKNVKQELPGTIPLIGFAGGPFTVLSYLIEGGSSTNFRKTLRFAYEFPEDFHHMMQRITDNTIRYLQQQQEAGIDVFQIFDTWAGILRPAEYEHWVLPFIQNIFEQIQLPSIYYLKNCKHLLELMDQGGSDFLSVCETVDIGADPTLAQTNKGIQGNLYNGLLYADDNFLAEEIRVLLIKAQKYDKYIFNLSHGIFPDISVDKVKFMIDKVREFSGFLGRSQKVELKV